jgi:hypothetical protein
MKTRVNRVSLCQSENFKKKIKKWRDILKGSGIDRIDISHFGFGVETGLSLIRIL